MVPIPPRERLSRLVELATQDGTAARGALANELADLLLDWPASYPAAMREPFEALLERTVRDVEPGLRAALAERFIARPDTRLSLLNLLVFDAAAETRSAILLRNALAADGRSTRALLPLEEAALLVAARAASVDALPPIFSSRFRIAPEIAAQILADESGWMLAILCKSMGAKRATFSALAVLARPQATTDESYRRLAAYDAVPQAGAEALLAFWRDEARMPTPAARAA